MSINPMQPSSCCLFFLPLILISMAAYTDAATSPYSPTDYFLLDCGSSGNTTTSCDGRKWGGDSGSATSNFSSFESKADRQGPSVEQVPYMTARIFKSQFTYSFSVSPGPKFLRLYFYPAVYSGINESDFFFTVTYGVYTLLSNFSASLTVAAMEPQVDSIVKEFIIHVWENQTSLNITFSPSPSFYAFVNGIEVCSMPNNLYFKGDSEQIPFVGTNDLFYIDNYTALETIYRLNVGGLSIGGEGDTGMFRKWQDDSSYIFGAADGVTWHWNDTDIRYTPATPAYTAPTAVYSSCRSMGPVASINLNYNLTWIFPLDSGFYYLVRLHFCEIVEDDTDFNQRVFDIFLNNETAMGGADVIAWSGGPGIPMYQDYVVYLTEPDDGSRGGKQDLWLALHPNMTSGSWFADAILNGLEIFKLNESYGSLAGPNPDPVPAPAPAYIQHPQKSNSKRLSEFIIIVPTLLFAIFALLFLVVYFFILRNRKRIWCWVSGQAEQMSLNQGAGFSLPKELSRRFALSELREATDDFNHVLVIGRGGFGDVYKGYIDGGDVIVAIKRLKSKSNQGAHEFLTEIGMLSQLRHQHLVSLIGYCEEEGEKILVYDYMHHGTLRDHLYGSDYDPLPWKQRLEICIGAARGLEYLHAGALHPIIHRDIKSTNILLDHKWVAKVADFGLSKMGPTQDPTVTTMVKGTFGYMDPEYCKTMKLTEKSDVYSFGVVLLEVICGRAAVDRRLEYEEMSLANWARGCIEKSRVNEIIDPILSGQIDDCCMEKFVEIAYDCLLDDGIRRPTMGDVVARLEFALSLQDTVEDPTVEAISLTLH